MGGILACEVSLTFITFIRLSEITDPIHKKSLLPWTQRQIIHDNVPVSRSFNYSQVHVEVHKICRCASRAIFFQLYLLWEEPETRIYEVWWRNTIIKLCTFTWMCVVFLRRSKMQGTASLDFKLSNRGENVVSSVSFSERFIENWDFGTHTLSRNYHCSKLCSTHSSSSQLSIDNHQLETFQKASQVIYYCKKYGNTWPRIGLLWQTRKYVLVSHLPARFINN